MPSYNKPILVETPADIGVPQVDFDRNQFDDFIFHHGNNVTIEHMLRCPCTVKGIGQPLPDCVNCGGSGYVFIDKRQTKIAMQSLSNMTRYSVWTRENMGTVSLTYRAEDKLGFMDRVVFTDLYSWFSQVVYPQTYVIDGNQKLFAFLIYPPTEVFHVYLFVNSSTALTYLLEGTDYTIEGNKIVFDNKFSSLENMSVSIRYAHFPAYHVVDITRDLRKNITGQDCLSVDVINNLPLHCIARVAHFITDAPNADGTAAPDNTNYEVPPINYDI